MQGVWRAAECVKSSAYCTASMRAGATRRELHGIQNENFGAGTQQSGAMGSRFQRTNGDLAAD